MINRKLKGKKPLPCNIKIAYPKKKALHGKSWPVNQISNAGQPTPLFHHSFMPC